MQRKDILSTSTLIVAMGLAGLAQAHDNSGDRKGYKADRAEIFKTLDADGNGEVTLEELSAGSTARFNDIDTNGDGLLSAEEIAAGQQNRAERRATRMIERLDADEDGQLSQAEIEARRDPAKMFAKLDADESGGVSEDEFRKARHHRGGHKHKGRHGD